MGNIVALNILIPVFIWSIILSFVINKIFNFFKLLVVQCMSLKTKILTYLLRSGENLSFSGGSPANISDSPKNRNSGVFHHFLLKFGKRTLNAWIFTRTSTNFDTISEHFLPRIATRLWWLMSALSRDNKSSHLGSVLSLYLSLFIPFRLIWTLWYYLSRLGNNCFSSTKLAQFYMCASILSSLITHLRKNKK